MTDHELALFDRAMSATVCDALDGLGFRFQALDPAIRPVWKGARMVGRAMPVVVACQDIVPAEPYEGEMDSLEALSRGDVPVFEIPAESRAAAWGELFSCSAIGLGAVGVVCDGLVRDAHQIEQLGFPAFARGCSPLDTLGRAVVTSHGDTALCGGVRVARGDLIVADADGVVAVPSACIDDVAAVVAGKRKLEADARDDLLNGMGIRSVWDKYQVF